MTYAYAARRVLTCADAVTLGSAFNDFTVRPVKTREGMCVVEVVIHGFATAEKARAAGAFLERDIDVLVNHWRLT